MFTMHILQIGDFEFVDIYYKFAHEYSTFAYIYHIFFFFHIFLSIKKNGILAYLLDIYGHFHFISKFGEAAGEWIRNCFCLSFAQKQPGSFNEKLKKTHFYFWYPLTLSGCLSNIGITENHGGFSQMPNFFLLPSWMQILPHFSAKLCRAQIPR